MVSLRPQFKSKLYKTEMPAEGSANTGSPWNAPARPLVGKQLRGCSVRDTRRWLPPARRWDTRPPRPAPQLFLQGNRSSTTLSKPAQHCTLQVSSSFQTAHGAGGGLTAGTGSLCVCPQEPRGAHGVAPRADAMAGDGVPSFSRTATSGTPSNFF